MQNVDQYEKYEHQKDIYLLLFQISLLAAYFIGFVFQSIMTFACNAKRLAIVILFSFPYIYNCFYTDFQKFLE